MSSANLTRLAGTTSPVQPGSGPLPATASGGTALPARNVALSRKVGKLLDVTASEGLRSALDLAWPIVSRSSAAATTADGGVTAILAGSGRGLKAALGR